MIDDNARSNTTPVFVVARRDMKQKSGQSSAYFDGR
jgi:hypothetical protein